MGKHGFFCIFHTMTKVRFLCCYSREKELIDIILQYTALQAVGNATSRSFARALNVLLQRYEDDCGVAITCLIADNDSKFNKSFSRYLKRKGIEIKYSVGQYKNAHIERRGRYIKEVLTKFARKQNREWPLCLEDVMKFMNEEEKIPPTKNLSPLAMYQGQNYSQFLKNVFAARPYLHASMYSDGFFPLSEKQCNVIFKFKIGERCLVDTTGLKPSLRKPLTKISEGRVKVWENGKIKGRKLVESAKNTLIQRYLARIPSLSISHWTYEHRLRRLERE